MLSFSFASVKQLIWQLLQVVFPGIVIGAAFKSLWIATGRVVVCWLNQWVCSFMRVFMGRIITWLIPLFDNLPQVGYFDISPMIQWWLLVDYYLPLNIAMAGISTCATFVIGFRTFRFVKQFFPALSN